MNYLAMAAKMGKDVTVLMELRWLVLMRKIILTGQRFLQDPGCKVTYGMEGYKSIRKFAW